jgi:N-acetylglucosamine-6-phosphate deacetylase
MIDLQVNGLTAKDLSFNCNFWETPGDSSIEALCRYEFKQGVTQILATLITNNIEAIEKSLARIQDYKKRHDNDEEEAQSQERTHVYGVHLEGGLISRLGIHPKEYARSLDLKAAQKLIKKFPGLIKLWTLCPKADLGGDLTRFLQDQDIKVSYGHSDANYEEALTAFEKFEVNLVTHWGNAMRVSNDFKHRYANPEDMQKNFYILDELDINKANPHDLGLGLAAYRDPKVYLMAICGSKKDGDLHLEPALIRKLIDKKKDKFILVSDSVAHLDEELGKPYAKLALRGGRRTLAEHCLNSPINELSKETVKQISFNNAAKAMLIQQKQ